MFFKKTTILLLGVFGATNPYAQNANFVWAKQMKGIPGFQSEGKSIAVDAVGNTYTAGYFQGTVDFDPGAGVFNLSTTDAAVSDIFICKLDPGGNFVWAKQMTGLPGSGSIPAKIVMDGSGNIYITGYFAGTIDFDPGPGVFNLSSTLNAAFVSKLDVSGNLIWAKQIDGQSQGNLLGTSVAINAAGNIYISGFFEGTVDFDPGVGVFNMTSAGRTDIFVAVFDGGGNFIWAKRQGGINRDETTSLALDIAGNIYVSGMADGDATGEGAKIYIAKMDGNGNLIWANQYDDGAGNFSYGTSLATDAQGNVFTTGYFNGRVDFGPYPGGSLTTFGDADIFILKLGTKGNVIWVKQLGGTGADIGSALAIDASDNIYITGFLSGAISAGGYCNSNPPSSDGVGYFISKLNASGQLVWTNKMIGQTGNTGSGSSIMIDVSGTIYTTGTFNGTIDFDPGISRYDMTSGGSFDVFVHKMTPCSNNTFSNITTSACNSFTLNCQTYISSGVYLQTIANTNGCDSIITLNLTVNDKSFSNISQTICSGETYSGHGDAGLYTDTLTAVSGCDSIRTLQLSVKQKPDPDFGADKNICNGDTLILFPGDYASYLWQDGSTQSHFTVHHQGVYEVTVSNDCGTGQTAVSVSENTCEILFPSAFSPNNDGRNESFKILHAPILTDFSLSVFNRWGQKIFETKDDTKGWDGTLNGQFSSTGVYVWFCKFRKPGLDREMMMNGTVLLIR